MADDSRTIRRNSGWMIGEQVAQQLIALALSVWMARSLGREGWGTLSFALSLYALFHILSTLGLNRILVREFSLAQDGNGERELLATAVGLRWMAGALVGALALGTCALIAREQLFVVAILVPGYFLSAFDVVDLCFQSKLRSQEVVRVRLAAYVLSSAIKGLLLLAGAGLGWIAFAYLLDWAFAAGALLVLRRRLELAPAHPRIHWPLARRLLAESRIEILAAFSGMAFMKVDQLMLQVMHGPAEVALMAVSSRLTEAWYFVPAAIVASAFPTISRLEHAGPGQAGARLGQLYRNLAVLSVAAAVAATVAAEPLITLLFGAQYRAAAPVLAVQVWCGLFMSLGMVSGACLMAHRRGLLNLRRNALGLAVNVALNAWLIPPYGALGAAWATLGAFAAAYLLYDFIDPAMRAIGRDKLRALAWRPMPGVERLEK